MANYYYSPDTGELINTTNPAAWMGVTTASPPAYDPTIQSAFFRAGAWSISSHDPALPLAEAQADQIKKIEAAYDSAIQLPVNYMGTTFQADAGSQDILAKTLVAGSVPAGFFWLDSANNQVAMTFAQLQGLASAMLAQGQAAFAKKTQLKAQIRAATDVASVQAVVW